MKPWPVGDGEMARRIRSTEWARTPLGPIEHWPQSLRTALDMVLAMSRPASLFWDPLHVQLYNDAYIAIAQDRHPALLGAPVAEGWPDAYEVAIRPVIEASREGRSTRLTDYVVALQTADGRTQERVFTLDWSPVRDEAGAAAGSLMLATEVTEGRRVERALRESEARHRLLVESWAQAVWETDPDGVVIADSPSWRAYTGQSSEAWLGYGWLDAIHPADRAYAERQWREAVAARALVDAEFRLRSPDGGWRWTNVRAAPVLDEGGRIEKWVGMNVDIDARKRREQSPQDSEERQAFLLRLSDALRPLSDPTEIMTTASASTARHLGLDRCFYGEVDAALEHAYIADSYCAPGVPPFPQRVRLDDFSEDFVANIAAGETLAVDDTRNDPRLADPARRDRFLAAHVAAFVGVPLVKGGQLVAILSAHQSSARRWTHNDIKLLEEVAERTWGAVERARAEAALRTSEARFRQFAEAAPEVVWIRDAATLQWEYLSAAFEAIYGLARDEVVTGDDLRGWAELILPEDREAALGAIERVRRGEQVTFDYRIRRPADGEVRWLRNTDFPVHDAAGRVQFIGGFGQDVTALKRADERLRDSERRQRALIEGIPQLVWRAVDGGRWTWASPQWSTVTGLSDEASRGLGWLEALHPDDRARARRAWETAEGAAHLEGEYRLCHVGERRYRWFKTRATPLRDEAGGIVEWLGTSTDIDDLRRLQDEQQVLVAELQHRTRNLIAVVRSIAQQTMAATASMDQFRAQFNDRLAALSRVQGLLSRAADDRITIGALLRMEVEALGVEDMDDRISLDGPEVALRNSVVQTLALALHELATNARKYGALAAEDGRLRVTWRVRGGDGDERRLALEWTEDGIGRQRKEESPTRTGYGRELIERALPYALGAATTYEMARGRVRCTIDMPLDGPERRRRLQ